MRVPINPYPINITARVVASEELNQNFIYETRLAFLEIEDGNKKIIDQTVNYFCRRDLLHPH
jgi:hypothetical protein